MRTIITPALRVLFDVDGNEVAAIALGKTAADSMLALAALRSGKLEPISESNLKRVSPVAPKAGKAYLKREDGTVLPFSVSVALAHTLESGGAVPEIV